MSKKSSGLKSFDFFTIGFGAIVGVGWAVSINNWMASAGGPLPAALGYILALIIMVPIALCYAELTPMLPVAGGGVVFAYKAFIPVIAFVSGWGALGGYLTIIPWEAIYTTNILGYLIPNIQGPSLYTFFGTNISLGSIIVGTILSFFLFFINWKGARTSAMVQKVLCIFLLVTGGIAIIAALFKADFSNLTPFYENVGKGTHTSLITGAIAIMASAPFFLAGFETISQGIENSEAGSIKQVGKTAVLSVIIACIFYAALLFSFGLAMPWQSFINVDTPSSANMFHQVYSGTLGTSLYLLILLGAICGLISTWNAFMLAGSCLMVGLARAQLIPSIFAKMHPKHDTPYISLLFCLCLSISGPFLGLGLIDALTSFSSAGFVLCWALSVFALIRLRKTMPNAKRPYKILGGLPMAWFGGIVTVVIFVLFFVPSSPCYIGNTAVILFLAWMLLGAVMYLGGAPARNRTSLEERRKALFAKMGKEE